MLAEGPRSRGELIEGIDLLVRRYLRAFGPAAPADVASWAGMGMAPVKAALERIELRNFRDERGGLLVDLPRAALPPADTPLRPKIFHVRNPQSEMTFLADGAVAGTWKQEGNRVPLHPFGRLRRQDRDELEAEAERLAAYIAN